MEKSVLSTELSIEEIENIIDGLHLLSMRKVREGGTDSQGFIAKGDEFLKIQELADMLTAVRGCCQVNLVLSDLSDSALERLKCSIMKRLI